MKNILNASVRIVLCIFVFAGLQALQADISDLVADEATVQKLAGDFVFTEGPAVDKEGNVYFSDVMGDKIYKWSLSDGLSTFLDKPGNTNGLFFMPDGSMVVCQRVPPEIVSISMDGKVTALTKDFEGKRYNQPNDLWPDAKGGIYFSDPFYGKEGRDQVELDGEYVYYRKPDGSVVRVLDDTVKPNGVLGTPDGKTLYVTDTHRSVAKTFSYKINEDGTLSEKTLFAPVSCDGMTLDEKGNLYLARKVISIYSSDGKELGSIEVPERPSNVCFGGKDRKTLFITARTSLYSIRMKVKGVN